MTDRGEFEKWYTQEGEYGGLPLDCHDGDGDYMDEFVQSMWMAWQAARATDSGSQGVPEGYVLAPKSMCITQEDVGLIAMMTGWDDEDQSDAEGVLWFGLIEDDEGNRTHGLNISCSECMEEGAIQLVQFDEPSTSPGNGWVRCEAIEPTMFWDADNSEENYQHEGDLADYASQDLRQGETMTVTVLCAKELPKRTMKIWINSDDEAEFEWISESQATGESK